MPRMDVTEMSFAKLYPLLVAKAVKKGRTREEVDQVTGSPVIPAKTLHSWSSPVSPTVISFGMLPP